MECTNSTLYVIAVRYVRISGKIRAYVYLRSALASPMETVKELEHAEKKEKKTIFGTKKKK